MNAKRYNRLGTFLTLMGGVLWGLSGVCGQYLFRNTEVTARWMVPFRLFVSGLLLLIFYLAKDGWKKSTEIWKSRKNAVDILIYGIIGMLLCQYTYFQAIEWSNAGTATVIQYLGPALVVVWVCFSTKRLPTVREILAVVLALLGVFFIATHGNPASLVLSGRALAIALLSAVSLVVYTVEPASLQKQFPTPLILAWGMLLGGGTLMFIFHPWTMGIEIHAKVIGGMGFIILFGTIASFSCYMTGVKMIGSVKASLYACVEPIASMVLTAVWMKVSFTSMDFFGAALIIATIILLGLPEHKKRGAYAQ